MRVANTTNMQLHQCGVDWWFRGQCQGNPRRHRRDHLHFRCYQHPGSGYSPGTYTGVTLTDVTGTGSGAVVNITVNATGNVSAVTLNSATSGGGGYAVGDQLTTLDIGAGSGFQVLVGGTKNAVTTVTITNPGSG